MRVIPIVVVDDTALAASNVPENDYAAWAIGTTYAADTRVISVATHSIYQSVAGGNVGNDPTDATNIVTAANPTGAWLYVSKTNRWRAFDGSNSAITSQASSVAYTLNAARTSDIIALMGVVGDTVRIRVIDAGSVTVFDETRDLVDTTGITTYFAYATFAFDDYTPNVIFYGIPSYPGTTLQIDIVSSSTASVAMIGYGARLVIGKTLEGTMPSIIDYSTKETDVFGETNIVKRAFAKTVSFNVGFPTSTYKSTSRALADLRSTAAIYYEDEDLKHDLIVLGFYTDYSPQLTTNYTLATIEITGVI